MTNYFYYDADRQKQGPVSEQQLKELAAEGTITPKTLLETDDGHYEAAGRMPGLFSLFGLPPAQAEQADAFISIIEAIQSVKQIGIAIVVILCFWLFLAYGPKICGTCDGNGKASGVIMTRDGQRMAVACHACDGTGFRWFRYVFTN